MKGRLECNHRLSFYRQSENVQSAKPVATLVQEQRSTDCGVGGRRVHPQIAWAKLRALRDGAAIASKKLWS
jgi:methionine synthase II (cobalamin-independent)